MGRFWDLFDTVTRTKSFAIGNHRLILNGRATIGPNFIYLCGMFACLGLLVFLILDVFSNRIITQIIFLVLVKIEYLLLAGVGCTEPGIVPRKTASSAESVTPAPSIETIVNGVKIDRKWCYTCNLYRPSRGKHCALCNCCIDKFDHHCVWLSNCIAERNYRKFFFLITNSMMMSLFVLISLSLGSGFEGWKSWAALLLSFSLSLITGNLFIYHLKLILRGSTSYETVRGSLGESNPFSLGDWRANLNAFLSRPTDPSQVAVEDKPTNWKRSRGAKEEEEITTLTNEFGAEDPNVP